MNKFIILPLLLLFAGTAFAQSDVVWLKDGSVIKGSVSEHLAQDHTRITTSEGKVYEYQADQIKKVRINGVKTSVNLRENGYYNSTSLGLLLGRQTYGGLTVEPSIQVIQGYQFKGRMNVGLGTGIDIMRGDIFLPAFAEFRYHFRKEGFSPYVAARAGYSFQLNRNYNWWGDPDGSTPGGLLTGAEFGIRNYGKRNLGWTASLGYRFQIAKSSYNQQFWSGEDFVILPILEQAQMHRIEMRFGILFH